MTLHINHTRDPFAVDDLTNREWERATTILIDRYWSGEPVPAGRCAEGRALWSSDALHVRFDCHQSEPLVASADPNLSAKTIGLWERDVCEVFIAPHLDRPNRYFEFEAAPTGEWLDLIIERTPQGRLTDWEYRSGLSVASGVEEGRVVIAMQIPWDAFGKTPKPGDVWWGNFFRCVGQGPDRGYLAWQPTLTPKPNFHVPEKFGELVFGS